MVTKTQTNCRRLLCHTFKIAWRQFFARILLCCSFLLIAPIVTGSENEQRIIDQGVMEVFVREGCPHCADAKEFLQLFASQRPGLQIIYRSLDSEPTAITDLVRLYQNAGIWPPGVPTFVIGDRILVGFDSVERSGPEIALFVEQNLKPVETLETSLFGTLSVSRLGLPLFTLSLGLLDGFNPCAMWVLLFLLSLLVHLHDRKRMAMIAGTFVLVSGAIYYAFMAAWLNLFLLVGLSTTLLWGLGGVALVIGFINIRYFLLQGQGFSLSIPDSVKPGLYQRMRSVMTANSLSSSLAGVALLAVIVNFIELLCTAGLPAIYSAVLTQQNLNPLAHYAYLGLYILGYVADDGLMVTMAVVALSSRKLSEETGRWLKLLSGVVMITLGVVMILRPEWLS